MAYKILVVEDNELNRTLIMDILAYFGYAVIGAENGGAALKKAREHLPGLILLDIQMPVMNGFDTIRALRMEPALKEIKVIAITSFAMKGDQEKIMAAGFDGYIAKPIDTHTLPKIVREFLHGM